MKTPITLEEKIKALEIEISHKDEAIRKLQDDLMEARERIMCLLDPDYV